MIRQTADVVVPVRFVASSPMLFLAQIGHPTETLGLDSPIDISASDVAKLTCGQPSLVALESVPPMLPGGPDMYIPARSDGGDQKDFTRF